MHQKIAKTAVENLLALANNIYPGRGIIAGLDDSGKNLIFVYWIMGRSENSRNRIFVEDGPGILKTKAADPAKVKDPSLIIYTAIACDAENKMFVVSNGHQTEDIVRSGWETLDSGDWAYEPDEPNYTPRISATFDKNDDELNGRAKINILKKSPASVECNSFSYNLSLLRGFGYCVTTYFGDGDPLPSFTGDPYLLPLHGEIENIAENIWSSLNEDNRVSLAVEFINIETMETKMEIINRF